MQNYPQDFGVPIFGEMLMQNCLKYVDTELFERHWDRIV